MFHSLTPHVCCKNSTVDDIILLCSWIRERDFFFVGDDTMMENFFGRKPAHAEKASSVLVRCWLCLATATDLLPYTVLWWRSNAIHSTRLHRWIKAIITMTSPTSCILNNNSPTGIRVSGSAVPGETDGCLRRGRGRWIAISTTKQIRSPGSRRGTGFQRNIWRYDHNTNAASATTTDTTMAGETTTV